MDGCGGGLAPSPPIRTSTVRSPVPITPATRPSHRRTSSAAAVRCAVALLLATLALGGCVRAAALTNGCDAYEAWAQDGFPEDLTSEFAGPRYLGFLARVDDTAPPVHDEARTVLEAAQRIHDAWLAAGGPDGPADQVAHATSLAEELRTPAVLDAMAEIRAYGESTCGITFP